MQWVGFVSSLGGWCALQPCKTVIHVHTGDRGSDEAVADWLERHNVEIVECGDAFDACVIALTQRDRQPDLALVGADWLSPAEFSVVEYFRESWPSMPVVVYGSTPAAATVRPDALTLVCGSRSALERLLAESPDALLGKSLGGHEPHSPKEDAWRPRPRIPAPEQRQSDPTDDGIQSQSAHRPGAATADNIPESRPSPRESGNMTDSRAPAASSILTEEELAELLKDEQK